MMLEFAVSLFSVIAFAGAFWFSSIVSVAQQSVSSALSGLSAITDSDLSDREKEKAVSLGTRIKGHQPLIFLLPCAVLSQPSYHSRIISIVAVAVQFDKVVKHKREVIGGLRTILVACDPHGLPGGEVGVQRLRLVGERAAKLPKLFPAGGVLLHLLGEVSDFILEFDQGLFKLEAR